MDKRGISGIIVTVILVAISVGLIALVAVVITNLVSDGLDDAVTGSSRVNLQIDESTFETKGSEFSFKVERGTGEGELKKIKFIFTDESDNTHVREMDSTIGQSEGRRITFDYASFGEEFSGLKSIEVVPIIETEKGVDKELSVTDEFKIKKLPVVAEESSLLVYNQDNIGISLNGGNEGIEFEDDPVLGNVWSFSGGSDAINLASLDEVDLTGDMSVCFWIKPTNLVSQRNSIFGSDYGDEFVIVFEKDGKIRWYHGESRTSGYTAFGWDSSPVRVLDDVWQHFCFVRSVSNQGVNLYASGEFLAGSRLRTWVEPSTGSTNFRIGETYLDSFFGEMTEFGVYDRVLTGEEVMTIYTQ